VALEGKVDVIWHQGNGLEISADKRQKISAQHIYSRATSGGSLSLKSGIEIIFDDDVSGEIEAVEEMFANFLKAEFVIQGVHLGEDDSNWSIIKLLDRRLAIEHFGFSYGPEIDADLRSFLAIHQGTLTSLNIFQDEPSFEALTDGSKSGLMQFIINCPNLRKLTISDCQDEVGYEPSVFDCRIFEYLPNLEELRLMDYENLSDRDINAMAMNLNPDLPLAEELQSNTNHNQIVENLHQKPGLKTIKLWKGYQIQNSQCFENFFNRHRHLQNVTLECFIDADLNPLLGRSLETMAQNNLDLVRLNIEESKFTDENLIRLIDSLAANCKSLEMLNIKNCQSETMEGAYEDEEFERMLGASVAELFTQCRFLKTITLPDGTILGNREAIAAFVRHPSAAPSSPSGSSVGSQELDQEGNIFI